MIAYSFKAEGFFADMFSYVCLGRDVMNITATLRRVSLFSASLLSLTLLVACSSMTTSSSSVATTEPIDEGVTDRSLQIASENQITITDSQTLAGLTDETLGLDLQTGTQFARLVIKTNQNTNLDYETSRLAEPARVVVDLFGTQAGLNRIYELEGNDYVSRVRIGAHTDKSRVVLDLQPWGTVDHDVQSVGQDIVITLADQGQITNVLAALSNTDSGTQNQIALIDPQNDTNIDTTVSDATEETTIDDTYAQNLTDTDITNTTETDSTETLDTESQQEDTTTTIETAQNNGPTLTNLLINDMPGGENRLVADMDSAGFFSLKRTAPSEYVLKLEGATFNSQSVQTILAAPNSGAIRSVRPVKEGNDTLLRIFTSPESTLAATVEQGSIVVKAQNNADTLALPDSEMRAQMENSGEVAIEEAIADSPEVVTNGANGNGEAGEIEGDILALLDETPKYTGRIISLDLQDTDIDNALRIIAEVSNLNIIASDDVTGKVTLRLIDVPWDQALDVILKTNGLDKVQEGNVVRIAPVEKLRQEREALKQAKEAEEELEPLTVKYIRVSYARAADLQPLVETVISERGTVAYDERTNQLIIKDIKRGIQNIVRLVKKLDLRTPQVLLETQIVEAQRTILRELGAELGFHHVQSPATGNATGYNFPNSIGVSGNVTGANPGTASAFPAAGDALGGSAISILLDSADGTVGLDARLSALENEGRVRIVSRPAVATTNNTEAEIKSVETIRVKKPSGGTSVGVGTGASADGSGSSPDEIDIGIELTVTPQASPDYYVLLDIYAKSSTVGGTVVDGIPSEIKREATSTVLVSSGQTFAMGGIYKIVDNNSVNGVPFLKDVPFLGHLFRWSQINNSDEELIFFITPRIVEGSFDDAAMRVAS